MLHTNDVYCSRTSAPNCVIIQVGNYIIESCQVIRTVRYQTCVYTLSVRDWDRKLGNYVYGILRNWHVLRSIFGSLLPKHLEVVVWINWKACAAKHFFMNTRNYQLEDSYHLSFLSGYLRKYIEMATSHGWWEGVANKILGKYWYHPDRCGTWEHIPIIGIISQI